MTAVANWLARYGIAMPSQMDVLEAAIAGRASGVKVFLVGGFAKGGVRIVGRADLNLRSIKDLKGKKVGVTRGGPQEILLFTELAQHHLSW